MYVLSDVMIGNKDRQMAFSKKICEYFIWRIATLSPLAERRLEAEDYRHHLLVDEDGPEEQLYDLIPSLLNDLESIGISYGETKETLMSSDQNLDTFLTLMEYIFPCKLFLLLRSDKVLRRGLYYLLDGNNESDDYLQEWLEYLQRFEPRLYYIIEHFKGQLIGSGLFKDYLQGLMSHLDDLHIQPILDEYKLKAIDEFITKLKLGKDKLKSITAELNLDENVLPDMIEQIEHLCLDPEFASRVGSWLTLTYKKLHDSQRPFYLKLSKSLMTSFPLSVEYYTARKIDVTDPENCKVYALSTTLLGWATGKYHPKRYTMFPTEIISWMTDTVLRTLLSE